MALATDIGGGASYSMLRTAAEAYKVLQLQGQNLPALTAFHAMTSGNAKELFALMTLGDDRAVRATYVQGKRVR